MAQAMERRTSAVSQSSFKSHRSAEEITADYIASRKGSAASHMSQSVAANVGAANNKPVTPTKLEYSTFELPSVSQEFLEGKGGVGGPGDEVAGVRPGRKKKKKEPKLYGISDWPPNRRYIPGPTHYNLGGDITRTTTRYGTMAGPKYTCGGSDRSFVKEAIAQSAGPGPKYHVSQPPIFARPGFSFGRDHKYTTLPQPKNGPVTVPGPGRYNVRTTRQGNEIFTPTDGPAFGFPKAKLSVEMQKMYLSKGTEFLRACEDSPGPVYDTRTKDNQTSKFHSDAIFTMPEKIAHHGESLRRVQFTPGPGAYVPRACRDGAGSGDRALGVTCPVTRFTKANARPSAEQSIPNTPYLSKTHCDIENVGVGTPAPSAYGDVKLLPNHNPKVNLAGFGPRDRFYDGFEPHRIR